MSVAYGKSKKNNEKEKRNLKRDELYQERQGCIV
jgi:hypothetical protein